MHAAIAAAFARHGYATLVPDYRLQKPNGLLRQETRRRMPEFFAEAEACGEEMQPLFWRHAAMAVLDDMGAFFDWLATHRERFGLAENALLAGSSAGGITALNAAYLLDRVGFAAPLLSSVAVLSGGFAYPSFAVAQSTRVLAMHNPSDVQVPVSSIRRLAALRPDTVMLIESDTMIHGEVTLGPSESLQMGVERLVRFDRDPTFKA
jgi:acetyl esterase/lipase